MSFQKWFKGSHWFCESCLLRQVIQSWGDLLVKAQAPLDLSFEFGVALREPPEDLKLQTGLYGVNISAR